MKAVLVFVEGAHDAVFVQRSLGAVDGCVWVPDPISDLPTPFGQLPAGQQSGIIDRHYRRQNLDGLNLQQASRAPLPHFTAFLRHEPSDTQFLIVRAHGQDQHRNIIKLLGDLDLVMKTARQPLDVEACAAAFLYDADDDAAATVDLFRQRYADHFGDLSSVDQARWQTTDKGPAGCFIFCAQGQDSGTLEDELGPMVEGAWPARTAAARAFIDGQEPEDSDKVGRSEAKHWKAIITAAGQRRCPGDPMSIVIGRAGLPENVYAQSRLGRDLAQFLLSVPW